MRINKTPSILHCAETPFCLPSRPSVVGRFVVINFEGKSEFTMSKYNWDVVVANIEWRNRKPSILEKRRAMAYMEACAKLK